MRYKSFLWQVGAICYTEISFLTKWIYDTVKHGGTFIMLAVSPFHSDRTPLFLIICMKQSIGPLKWTSTPPKWGRRELCAWENNEKEIKKRVNWQKKSFYSNKLKRQDCFLNICRHFQVWNVNTFWRMCRKQIYFCSLYVSLHLKMGYSPFYEQDMLQKYFRVSIQDIF